jgi:hypothetical protein
MLVGSKYIFLKRAQKLCPDLFIKKKRIDWLINRKPDKKPLQQNHKRTTQDKASSEPTSTHNLLQLPTNDI